MTQDPIPVLPTVHYNMGGIPTNHLGEVRVSLLFPLVSVVLTVLTVSVLFCSLGRFKAVGSGAVGWWLAAVLLEAVVATAVAAAAVAAAAAAAVVAAAVVSGAAVASSSPQSMSRNGCSGVRTGNRATAVA